MIAISLLVGSAALAWWLIGDVSEIDGYMQIVPEPPLSGVQTAVVGVAGLTGVIAAGTQLVDWYRRRLLHPAGLALAGLGFVSGIGLAGSGRILSSKTVGANIGGGMIVLAGPFVAILLAVLAIREWRALRPG
jgi:hypothetical protein